MCGRVGDDSLGIDYLNQLKQEGVRTEFMTKSINKTTGIASINVETSSGANTIVIVPGANEDIQLSLNDESHKVLIEHIKGAKILICQNEIPSDATLTALQIARSGDTLSIFNPAPALPSLIDLAILADIVCPNETELSTLTSLPTDTEENIARAAAYLLSAGCKVVIVTIGDKGAYLATKKKSLFIRATKVTGVDTTGAGDSFIGTLASNLARGCRLEKAVENSLHCATISVTKVGAQTSYAHLKELSEDFQPPTFSGKKFDIAYMLTLE
jgi:ribokinase